MQKENHMRKSCYSTKEIRCSETPDGCSEAAVVAFINAPSGGEVEGTCGGGLGAAATPAAGVNATEP